MLIKKSIIIDKGSLRCIYKPDKVEVKTGKRRLLKPFPGELKTFMADFDGNFINLGNGHTYYRQTHYK